jgi:predicted acetyltransferase
MDIQLVAIDSSSTAILTRLLQLYAYDFSEMTGTDILENGLFSTPKAEGFFELGRHPMLIKMEGKLAGFVIVDQKSRFGTREDPLDVAEFFVLRKFRKQGVGQMVAHMIFDRYHGQWEVRQVPKNQAATLFWRTVIHRYTSGSFEESEVHNEHWQGIVQRFDNRKAR